MLQTQAQYDYVKEILLKRMKDYRRDSFKLQKLFEIILKTASTEAYIDFSYKEFYDMFVKECVGNKIPNHTFTIAEEGYLDIHKRYPYANIHCTYVSPRSKKTTMPSIKI